MQIISDYVLSNIDALAEKFKAAEPFPHVSICPFFAPNVCEQMVRNFPMPKRELMLNELGQRSLKNVRPDVRSLGKIYEHIDDYIQSAEFAKCMESITGIPNLLYDPDYFGGGTHENLSGQEMDTHVDFNYHPTTGYHRRINAIIYLNEEWDESWGGCLELHKNPWDPESDWTVKYPPLFNNCVVFETSEVSWHGFESVAQPMGKKISRKSFAIYMYTKDRPIQETAEEHTTVYVQRPLPERIVEGYVMQQDDIQELKANFAKRNSILKGLYEREKVLNATIRSLGEASKALRIPTLGYVWHRADPEGMHANQGMGYQLKATFVAAKPVNRVTVRGRIPDFVGSNKLTIEVADQQCVLEPDQERWSVTIDTTIKQDSEFLLKIKALKAVSMKEAGLGVDLRKFSCFIDEVVFEHPEVDDEQTQA